MEIMQCFSVLFSHKTLCFSLFLLSGVGWTSSLPDGVSRSLPNRAKNDGLPTLYMNENCREMFGSFIVDNAYLLIDRPAYLMVCPMENIVNARAYITVNRCLTSISAPPGQHLLFHFLDIAISRNMSTAKSSKLYMYSGPNAAIPLKPYNGIFGETKGPALAYSNIRTKDYVSPSQALTLYFDGLLNRRFYGFKAVVTPISWTINGTCPTGKFRCRTNSFCISDKLVCDGVSNCGDQDTSDETRCTNKSPPQKYITNLDDLGLMIGCAVSILVLLMAVIWVGVMCRRSKRLRHQRHQLRNAAHHALVGGLLSENPRWLPTSLANHLPPWMFSGPPPAYSETPNNDECTTFEPPPQYSAESCESRSLIHPSDANRLMETGQNPNVISNIHALVGARMEQPPSYEEANSGPALMSLLQPVGSGLAPQYPVVGVGLAPEYQSRQGLQQDCEGDSQQEYHVTGANLLLENNFVVQNDHTFREPQE